VTSAYGYGGLLQQGAARRLGPQDDDEEYALFYPSVSVADAACSLLDKTPAAPHGQSVHDPVVNHPGPCWSNGPKVSVGSISGAIETVTSQSHHCFECPCCGSPLPRLQFQGYHEADNSTGPSPAGTGGGAPTSAAAPHSALKPMSRLSNLTSALASHAHSQGHQQEGGEGGEGGPHVATGKRVRIAGLPPVHPSTKVSG
jgi:hypothetical protein